MMSQNKPLKRLDPTWWRKVTDGYDQQATISRTVARA
jgi:hypothetical protein